MKRAGSALQPVKSLLIICAIAVALWIVLQVVYRGSILLNQALTVKHSASFLHAVQNQKVAEAAQRQGGMSRKEDIDAWTADLQKLFADGFRLHSYDHVSAEFDDGCVCTGHANLVLDIDGRKLPVKAILTFNAGGQPKQVCALTPPGIERDSIPELKEWNRIACGGSF